MKPALEFGYDIHQIARRKAEQGRSDAELAALAGVHATTIRNVLTGRSCRPATVKAVAEALGLDLAELVVPAEAEAEPQAKTPEETAA